MENPLQFGISRKNARTLLLRGHEFWRKKTLKSGAEVWRCSKWRTCRCNATVVTRDERVVKNAEPEHTHQSNQSTIMARNSIVEMKRHTVENGSTPAAAIAAVSATLPGHIKMALPDKSVIARNLRRGRQKAQGQEAAPLPPVPVDKNFIIPDQFKEFVLVDSGMDDQRILIFGCSELLNGLERSRFWLADGTFKVVPTLFFQLYTIHFSLTDGITPIGLYCLLANKTRDTYDRLLIEVKRLAPAAAPDVILIDFESAAMSAFRQGFPQAQVKGCYFHLTQSIMRKAQDVGLKATYETDIEIQGFIRCLSAISHVPTADVQDTFDTLVEQMPDVEHMDELVTYFEHTYVRGRRQRGRGENYGPPLFSHDVWNQHDAAGAGIARTTNTCEGWHHGVQSLMQCSHPTMWRFIEGLRRDQAVQLASFLQGAAGSQHPSERRYRVLS